MNRSWKHRQSSSVISEKSQEELPFLGPLEMTDDVFRPQPHQTHEGIILLNSTTSAVQKIRPCRVEIGNSVEHQWAGGIEDGLVMIAVELAGPPKPPPVASRQAASAKSSGNLLRLSKQTSHEFIPARSGPAPHVALLIVEVRGSERSNPMRPEARKGCQLLSVVVSGRGKNDYLAGSLTGTDSN